MVVDPDSIYKVRQNIIGDLVSNYRDTLLRIYKDNHDDKFANDFTARSRRALKNTCLAYLLSDRSNPAIDLAKLQYDSATNMTDRVAALSALTDINAPERDQAFDDFYKRFKDYQLVIDKWFSLQAMAIRPGTISDLHNLRKHPEFIITNPNRVRSLYSAFAMNNPVCFHGVEGAGYEFLSDAVIELNNKNPQIAARLLTPMREWKKYTSDRQTKMQEALQKIANTPDLSPDVFEIVNKTLAG
jgi:aminopeptidase N